MRNKVTKIVLDIEDVEEVCIDLIGEVNAREDLERRKDRDKATALKILRQIDEAKN